MQLGDQVLVYGTRDPQQRILAKQVVIQRQSQPPPTSIPLFQGRVLSVNTAKPSFTVQPDGTPSPVEVVVSSSTRYEQALTQGQQPPGQTRLLADVKVGSQVQVNGKRISGTQVQADLVILFEVAQVTTAGRAVLVDLAQNAVILGRGSFQINPSTTFTGVYKSSNDIQVGDIVKVTFTPGSDPAPVLSIDFQGRPVGIPGQTQPTGTQPATGNKLENVTDLAQTTQPGAGQTTSKLAFISGVQSLDRQTQVLKLNGMFLQVAPGTVLVDEVGRSMSLQALQQRVLQGENVVLRVEAEQRNGVYQITKGGAVDPANQSGDISGGQTGPLTVKSATFQATPSPIALANAVNVPLEAVLTVQFSGKISAGALNNSFIAIVPKPESLKPSVQNGNLVISAKLKASTAYTVFINLDALEVPVIGVFTTGASLPTGSVKGTVKLPAVKDIPLPPNVPADLLTGLKFSASDGFVLLMNQDPTTLRGASDEQVIAATVGAVPLVLKEVGTVEFLIPSVTPGKYYLAAVIDLRLVQQNGSPPPSNVQGLIGGSQFNFFTPYSKTPGSETPDQIDVGTGALTGMDIQVGFPRPISVVEVSPKDGSVSVPLETILTVRFSDQPAQNGNALGVNIQVNPPPLSGQINPGNLKLDGNVVSVPVKLQTNTVYQLTVQAAGQNRPGMKEPLKFAFTTGAKIGTGVVAGKLLPPPNVDFDRQAANGFVGLIPSDVDLKRLTPADLPRVSVATDQAKGSNYRIRNAPAGSYILFAVVDLVQVQNPVQGGVGGQPANNPPTPGSKLEGGVTELAQTVQPTPTQTGPAPTIVTGFYDKNKDGKPDVIQIKEGDPPLENMDIQTGIAAVIKQATRSLTVTATTPKDGETSVKLESILSITFSEPLAAGGRFVPVEVALIPVPEGFNNKPTLKDGGTTATFQAKLTQNTTYKLVINSATGSTGAELQEPVTINFSTGAVQTRPGSLSGKVTLSDKSTPIGSVKLIDSETPTGTTAAAKKVDIRASGSITRTGDYLIPSVPPGRSFLAFAEVDLGEAGTVQVFYDKNADGKPDVLTVKEGETLSSIDFTIQVPEKQQPGAPQETPNKGATVGLDLNPAQGNQGMVTALGVGTNARIDVAVFAKGVKDLTGFNLKASFDTAAVAFDSAEPYTSKEGKNLLESSGGRGLYLPIKVRGTTLEYEGMLLGEKKSSTAPDGDGLLGVLHFVTTRSFKSETTIEVPTVVFKGLDSKGRAVADTVEVGGEVTLVSMAATTQKVDLSALPEEIEGKVGVDLVDKTGKSLGRKLETAAVGDTLIVNILAKEGATGISGFSALLEFNPNEIEYVDKSFTAGPMMPGITALARSGVGSVEVGGAAIEAFGGKASTTASGVLGTVKFVVGSGYSGGTFIALTSASYQAGSTRDEFDLYTLILLGKVEVSSEPPPSEGLTPKAGDGTAVLDLDTAAGDQKSRTANNVKPGQKIDVQVILNNSYPGAGSFQVVLRFDPTQVSVIGWKKNGSAFAAALDLPAQVKADSVTYGMSILGGTTTANGPLAVLTFETATGFTGDTEITLASVQVRVSGVSKVLVPGASVVLTSRSEAAGGPKKPTPDFDGDGEVGFSDFFLFASAFGNKATGSNAVFDLDGDGDVGFGDFFVFASAFGSKVSGKPASLAKPVGMGAVGSNGGAQVAFRALPTDRADQVTVDVVVNGAAQVSGYGLDLSFDPAQLELVGTQPLGRFEAGAEGRPLLRSSDGLGQVYLADALAGDGVSGEGSLMRLTFRIRPGGGLGSLRVVDGLLLDPAGLTNRIPGVGLDGTVVPLSYGVGQNFPNPFNPVTQVAYQVPEAGRVRLTVYNVLGQRIRTLVEGQVAAGFYRVSWDGRDEAGRTVSSGIYLYRMEAGKFSQVHKMMLLK